MAARSTNFDAIGTKWDIQIQAMVTDDDWAQLLKQLHERIEQFDITYSRFRADSFVTKLSKKAGSYELPSDGQKLLDFYRALYEVTNGSVTPLIGQTMVEAGYDAAYSFNKQVLHRPPSWDEVLEYTSDSITIKQPILLDFGAAGKGYLVDIIAEIVEAAGVDTYSINAGGDIRHHSKGGEVLHVGLENPLDTSEAVGVAALANASLCASAGSKRRWSDLTHIIDPITLRSPSDIIATWVIAEDAMTADGIATALFFTEPQKLLERFAFSYALLRQDMQLEYAKGFPVKLFEAA